MRLVWFYDKLTMNDIYTRLCGHDRKVIANMAKAGNNQKAIVKAISRSQGTASKESCTATEANVAIAPSRPTVWPGGGKPADGLDRR